MTALTVGWTNAVASLSTAYQLYSIAGSANAAYPGTLTQINTATSG